MSPARFNRVHCSSLGTVSTIGKNHAGRNRSGGEFKR
jgi:hypothetical protein